MNRRFGFVGRGPKLIRRVRTALVPFAWRRIRIISRVRGIDVWIVAINESAIRRASNKNNRSICQAFNTRVPTRRVHLVGAIVFIDPFQLGAVFVWLHEPNNTSSIIILIRRGWSGADGAILVFHIDTAIANSAVTTHYNIGPIPQRGASRAKGVRGRIDSTNRVISQIYK